MALRDRITEEMKTAMRAGDKERLATIRLALAAIKQREVDERITLDDSQVLAVLEKMIKQRREAITQFESGGRADLVAKETAEIAVLQTYLPAQMSDAEVDALIAEAIAATGATTIKDMGKVMARREAEGPGTRRHGRGQRPDQAETRLTPLPGARHVGRIPQHFIDELIARADIVEVIGARVQLKKAGREYKACCPFHNEKTPSFWVSPDKQFYHCFGCGAHGTVLGFLMEHDHMAFPEAVEELATRLGLEVPHEGGADAGPRRADEPLYELMARVAKFYAEALAREPRARDYAARRGLTADTVERFGIGYAPNSWNEVLKRFGGGEAERKRAGRGSA